MAMPEAVASDELSCRTESNQRLSCPAALLRSGRKTTHGKGKRNAFFVEERARLTVTRRR